MRKRYDIMLYSFDSKKLPSRYKTKSFLVPFRAFCIKFAFIVAVSSNIYVFLRPKFPPQSTLLGRDCILFVYCWFCFAQFVFYGIVDFYVGLLFFVPPKCTYTVYVPTCFPTILLSPNDFPFPSNNV